MKASELFDDLKNTYLSLKPSKESLEQYDHITSMFAETVILKQNHFSHIKNSRYIQEDLAFELMFFNSQFVHNIDISPHRTDITTLTIKEIGKVCLADIGNNEALLTVNILDYNSNMADLFYQTNMNRYRELNLIRNSLLGLLTH